jgi:heme-degrading monooxygenase HmoA
MYARTVRMELKPNSAAEFNRLLEKEILPMLQKQQGFKDEMVFVPTDGKEAMAISLWAEKEHADSYHRSAYPEVAKSLAKVIVGVPRVETLEVINSTLHKVAVRQAV